MAGLGLPAPAHPNAISYSLPTGPCSHRDVIGTCGCERFWDSGNADVYDGTTENHLSTRRSTGCVCGHHACFHKSSVALSAASGTPSCCDNSCQAQQGAHHCEIQHVGTVQPNVSQLFNSPPSHTTKTQLVVRKEALPANASRFDHGGRDPPSLLSSSGLPRIPSVCLMSKDQYPAANSVAKDDSNQCRQSVSGLGLSTLNVGDAVPSFRRQQSVASTIPDELDIRQSFDDARTENDRHSTRPNSVEGEQGELAGAGPGALNAILEFNNQNQNLHLDVSGDTIPNTFNLEDFVQSATEVATPSIRDTPDLAVADQDVQHGKMAIEHLMQVIPSIISPPGTDDRPASAKSAPSPQLLLTNSPHLSQEHVRMSLKTALTYLPPLYNLLNSMPNVANTLKEQNDRLSLLESNNSFNYAHPGDVQEVYDTLDSRLGSLEHRMDEHDMLHRTIDADNSSVSFGRRKADVSASFQSNRSLESTTSSALILAAMDRKETETQIRDIKERLDTLEAFTMPPTLTNPWEIEVVLLPWGRDLKGIWFAPDEPMHIFSNLMAQDSEEWTQARGSLNGQPKPLDFRETDSSPFSGTKTSSRSSHPFSDSESGWSSQAISNWASDLADGLLLPKACKSTNLVYKRLRSRGLVKDIALKGSSSRDIQAVLSHAFKDMLEHLKYTDEDDGPVVRTFPGLRASFIPLRKVRHDSKLQFLTPAEMSSAALWSSQFLSSDILMHVTGGKKRLYVTQREAYIQSQDQMGSSWTWQELRQLPRFQPNSDVHVASNPEVGEADAKEACWAFIEAYDAPPPSINSSFTSHHSVELSMRPAGRNWRRSITPMSILKNPMPQPISPLSEVQPRRTLQARQRTVSASLLEPVTKPSKRRLNSSPVKHSSFPHATREPSSSVGRTKRRRVSRSSSPQPAMDANEVATEVQMPAWNNTPRRSREPFSPFFSSVALPLPRTASDLASRPSQRSATAIGKGTPFAYATPHSGPLVGGPGFDVDGDTEADDDLYQDDDGEQSWRGVTTGEEDSELGDDAEVGAREESASFSGDDSGFGSDGLENDGDESDGEVGLGAQRTGLGNTHEDEKDDDPLDALLDVLRR